MKDWSIRKQIILMAMLPALFTSCVLIAYFTYSQLQQISDNLNSQALSIVSQIAPTAEYAIFSGNTKELEYNLQQVINNQDITRINIINKSGETILSLRDDNENAPENNIYNLFFTDIELTFRQDIVSRNLPLADYDNGLMPVDEKDSQVIGTVELQVSNHYSNKKKAVTLTKSSLITLGIMILIAMIALRVSRRISRPIQKLTEAVKKIAAGHLETKLDIDAPAELGILEKYVNQMAQELKINQEDLEARIDEYTDELQQTLEELEIRNAQLDITKSDALQASSAKSEFLANMSHEIRTPLSGILGFTELLEASELSETQRDYINIISDSSRNLLSIIEEILDISKIESGKLDIVTSDCDLIEVMDNVISILSPVSTNKNIELIYNFDNDTPLVVLADAFRLQQILTNLIGNAIKFTQEGYIYIVVEPDPDQQDYIRFSITDTGIGLSDSEQSKLFSAFTQADYSITRKFGGTGLGLTISRKLIHLMGGDIGFNSQLEKGSTFWITLPDKPSPNPKAAEPGFDNRPAALLFDSLPQSQAALQSMLRSWGLAIHCSATTDIDPADLQAHELFIFAITYHDDLSRIKRLVQIIKAETPSAKIISISSITDSAFLTELKQAGIDETISRHAKRKHIYSLIDSTLSDVIVPQPTVIDSSTSSLDIDPDATDLHVLVVDDNHINLKLASILLNNKGFNTSTASSGEQAISMVEQQDFDFILMDLNMPDMDGYETTRIIRQRNNEPRPTIIALTANLLSHEKDKALDAGMDAVQIKPINEELLQSLLSQHRNIKNRTDDEVPAPDTVADDTTVFSAEQAIQLSSNNIELAKNMTKMFIAGLAEQCQAINTSYENRQLPELKREVHKLNGATRYCAVPALRKLVIACEAAIEKTDLDRLDSLVLQIQHQVDTLLATDIDSLFDEYLTQVS